MRAYVRYLGTKACWTLDDGRFYIGETDELNSDERKACENGGGYVSIGQWINAIAR